MCILDTATPQSSIDWGFTPTSIRANSRQNVVDLAASLAPVGRMVTVRRWLPCMQTSIAGSYGCSSTPTGKSQVASHPHMLRRHEIDIKSTGSWLRNCCPNPMLVITWKYADQFMDQTLVKMDQHLVAVQHTTRYT